jgi:hypothetical protein
MLLGLLAPVAAEEFEDVRAEPNLEKRSERALRAAEQAMSALSTAYSGGDAEASEASAGRMMRAVELAAASLEASGKNPHRSKYYKRAEIGTRSLARRLTDFAEAASIDDRPRFLKLRDRVLAIHDKLLNQILLRKKK